MEETVIEIPETSLDEGWQPPVLTHRRSDKPQKTQSCADVFFMQYVVCILLVTAVLAIRFCDRILCDDVLAQFQAQTHAPDVQLINQLIAFLESRWN